MPVGLSPCPRRPLALQVLGKTLLQKGFRMLQDSLIHRDMGNPAWL